MLAMEVVEKKLLLKLFAGFLITSELRMHLNQSIRWKEAKILKEFDATHLVEVHFKDENYIGKFLKQPMAKLSELKVCEQEIREGLKIYCPTFRQEKCRLKILFQQFIP